MSEQFEGGSAPWRPGNRNRWRGAIAKVVGSIAVRPFPSLWHSNATRTSLLMVRSRSSIRRPAGGGDFVPDAGRL